MDISNTGSSATLAFDPTSMQQHRSSNDADALEAAAVQFESLLIEEMLKSMRNATDVLADDNLFNRDQERYYQSMYDSQLAFEMASNGSLGVANQLIEQVQLQQGMTAPEPGHDD